ncbi:MAG: alanine--tRNA ligase, partial [Chitinophagaceae bacterium]|nr:alanine--tRNA ligase [Chitinophagaceae bacterium]
LHQLQSIKAEFKNPKDLLATIKSLQDDKTRLQKQVEKMEARMLVDVRKQLLTKAEHIGSVLFLADQVEVSQAEALRTLCLDLKNELNTAYVVCLTANIGGKAAVAISVDENSPLDAVKLIREKIAPRIKGGGGGQKTLATAGGQDVSELKTVIELIRSTIL